MINPDFLDDLGWRMGEVYAAVTDRLLINLAKRFRVMKPDEAPGGAFEYQAQKLAEMGQVTAESVRIIVRMLGGADEALRRCIEQSILAALDDVEPQLRAAAEAGLLGAEIVPPEVSPRMTAAFAEYYAQSADKLNLVNTVMLESTQNAYARTVSDIVGRVQRAQGILNVAAGQLVTGAQSFNVAMRDAVNAMVENGLTGYVDHGGHHWTPEAYVAMDMRTTFHNTARRAFWDRNEEYGNDLYIVSQHPGARPLCYPWQCKVISRANDHRWVKDGAGNPVQVFAENETTYGEPAGLFGINCGHHPYVWIAGASMVPEVAQNDEANAKQYAESQKQRELERELRKAKLALEVERARGSDAATIREKRADVKRAGERLDDFCDATGRKRRREREYAPVNATWPK